MYMIVNKDGCVYDSYDLLGLLCIGLCWWVRMEVYRIVGNPIVKDIWKGKEIIWTHVVVEECV